MKTKRIYTPEQKAKAKARAQRPDVIAKAKARRDMPEVAAKRKDKRDMPEAKAKKNAQARARLQRPGAKARSKAYQAEWYARPENAGRKRAFKLKYMYGITLDDYDRMLVEQNFCCAICRRHQSKLSRALGVDHNHVTGDIRGLLCSGCNTAIRKLNADDGIETLKNAIEYLEK